MALVGVAEIADGFEFRLGEKGCVHAVRVAGTFYASRM
jgi:hypothetical protein